MPGLNSIDRLVRDYAAQVTRDPRRVSDRMFDELKTHFSEAQIVELTLRTALCSFFSRFNQALDIELEEEYLSADLATLLREQQARTLA